MDLGLTDRVFVVTGGSRGLGRATAEVLVAEGARSSWPPATRTSSTRRWPRSGPTGPSASPPTSP